MMTTRSFRIVVLEVFFSRINFDALSSCLKIVKIGKKKGEGV